MFDGIVRDPAAMPNPNILGDQCHRCCWPVATCYTTPDAAPHAICGPAFNDWRHEDEAFRQFGQDPGSGIELKPAITRDADWSQGCLAARTQLQ